MNRLFLSAAMLIMAIPAGAQTNCAEHVEKPVFYPPLARQALISGEVKAHFDVGADGKAMNMVTQGHPLLRQVVESVINKTTMESECRASVDLTYKFAFEDEVNNGVHTSITFNPPNEYVVMTNRPKLIAIVEPAPIRRSWFKRLFHL